MFFCESCRKKKDWPGSWFTSRGPCEICGKVRNCNEVPSAYLPAPVIKEIKDGDLMHSLQSAG